MKHPILTIPVASLAFASLADGQEARAEDRMRPVTAPIHEIEGTLDLATGRFRRTRRPALGLDDKQEVYDNTCTVGFYLGLAPAGPGGTGSGCPETLGDWGAIPGTGFPGDASCTTGCASPEYCGAAPEPRKRVRQTPVSCATLLASIWLSGE